MVTVRSREDTFVDVMAHTSHNIHSSRGTTCYIRSAVIYNWATRATHISQAILLPPDLFSGGRRRGTLDEGEGLPGALVPRRQHHSFLCRLLCLCYLVCVWVGNAPGDGLKVQRLSSVLEVTLTRASGTGKDGKCALAVSLLDIQLC